MPEQENQISHGASIIGMDIFTVEYPDMKVFKRMLINSEIERSSVIPLSDQIDQSLTQIGINVSTNIHLSLIEKLIQLVMNRALLDTHLGQTQSKKVPLSIVIHAPHTLLEYIVDKEKDISNNPFNNIQKNFSSYLKIINLQTTQDDFHSALKQAQGLTQENNSDLTLFLSFFLNPKPQESNSESGSENSERRVSPDQSLGLGCLVLSNEVNKSKPYAQLKTELFMDNHIDTDHQIQRFKYLNTAPITCLIMAAVEINTKTNFPGSFDYKYLSGAEKIPSQSYIRPWFTIPYNQKRKIHLTSIDKENNGSSIILEKDAQSVQHPDRPFLNLGFFLLPISFNNSEQAAQNIENKIIEITECSDFDNYLTNVQNEFILQKSKSFSLVILGNSKLELLKELDRAKKGIPTSFENGKDWQTPVGSFFTPNPLGPNNKVTFVYPGAFSTYIGMGNEVFYLFPQLHDAYLDLTADPGTAINEDTIFPEDLSSNIRDVLQDSLNKNPTQMISSGISFSFLFTVILRDILKVKPDSAIGYSLGENSMMFSMGIWSQADAMRTSLETSPIFHDRVSGPQNAIREFWNMPKLDGQTKGEPPVWANYVLMSPVEKVRAALQHEPYVYITHINTPRQVVIGGKPESCQRVVDSVNCMYLKAPYNHAIHCEPVESEFDAFRHLHDWPTEAKPIVSVFTAATFGILPNTSDSIAKSFAKMLTKPIDFPRLINLAYEDGARIFIELGAGSNCSKWIDGTLKGKPHAALSINQNTIDDHVSILRLIARLVSHQLPVDLKEVIGESNEC
jgi:PfaB family protein